MRWNYVAFEGPIGVGKTSLVTLLSERLQAVRLLEDVSNPFLESFYDEVPGAAFQAQLFFLLSRYRQLTEAAQGELFQQLLIEPKCLGRVNPGGLPSGHESCEQRSPIGATSATVVAVPQGTW